MLWVVIGHSPLSVPNLSSAFDTDYHECAMFLKKIAYSFHMPLFIMISGYLFYITRINKGSQYKKTLSDKFVRLGIPYVFFTVFAFFLKVYAGGVQRPVALSLKSFLCAFVWPFDGPLQGTYPYFYVLCVLSGIYIPVLISKVIQRVGNKYLNLLIGL
jgi:fucose 4-O-acetylase-like acetyltransferase